jgi:ABC-2 type transport system ATP-binding protein
MTKAAAALSSVRRVTGSPADGRTNSTSTCGAAQVGPNLEAVKGLDFDVRHGEVFGLLEPNGAGKTRTVETTAQDPAELQAWLKRVDLKKLGEAK